MRYGFRLMQVCSAAGCLAGATALMLVGGCKAGGLRSEPNTAVANDQRTREAADLAYRAKAALDKGRVDEALDLSKQAVNLDPNHAGAWNNLGAIAFHHDRLFHLEGGLKYHATRNFGVVGGYKYERYRWVDDDNFLRITSHGPFVGGMLRF